MLGDWKDSRDVPLLGTGCGYIARLEEVFSIAYESALKALGRNYARLRDVTDRAQRHSPAGSLHRAFPKQKPHDARPKRARTPVVRTAVRTGRSINAMDALRSAHNQLRSSGSNIF
jgi:hypothetical protein